MTRTYKTPAEAVALLKTWGARTAIRYGAQGPNNNVRRGTWEIDGRPATAPEARQLNAIDNPSFVGVRFWEAEPGAIAAMSEDD